MASKLINKAVKTAWKKSKSKVSRGTSSKKNINAEMNANREEMQMIGEANADQSHRNGYHLVTSINIDSQPFENQLRNMKAYAAWIEKTTKKTCDIHVMMSFYQTNDPIFNNRISPAIPRKFLKDGRMILNSQVELITDIDIRPTIVNPLAGLQIVGETRSVVVPSPKRHDRMVSGAVEEEQRHLITSLSLGHPKYQRGRAGGLAIERHVNGFVIIEPSDSEYNLFPRQVSCDENGDFIDVTISVKNGKVLKSLESPEAYIFGDLHGIEANVKGIKNRRFLYESAKNILTHDSFSFANHMNHHEVAKPLDQRGHSITITEEIKQTRNIFKDLFGKVGHKTYMVDSNHDDSMNRWLNFFDINKIPTLEDRRLFLEASLWRMDNPGKSLMSFLFPELNQASPTTGFKVKGVHLPFHGHSWGARGGQFRASASRFIHGHTHRAGIVDNIVTVGHNIEKRPGYAKLDMANWSTGDAIISSNGNDQLLRMPPNGIFSNIHQRRAHVIAANRALKKKVTENKVYQVIELKYGKKTMKFATQCKSVDSAIAKKKRDMKRRQGVDPKTVKTLSSTEVIAGSSKEAVSRAE